MNTALLQFAADSAEASGGIGALGINVKALVFQLISFVIVLLILRRYVYGKLVETLEARRTAVIGSLEDAKQAAEDLSKAEAKIEKLLAEARSEANDIVSVAHKEATSMVEEAEAKAKKKAEHIVAEAKTQLDGEIIKARKALQSEVKLLVASATERIIGEKLTGAKDEQLIERALEEAKA